MKKKLLFFCLHHMGALKLIARDFVFLMALILFSADAYAQAELIRDVNTSENQVYPEYADLVPANDRLFFTSQRKELWNTDGTTAGTVRYKQFSSISDLIWIGPVLYFVGGTDGGRELCKSTGPGAATGRIKNIRPGPEGSDPEYLTNVNGVLYFVANDGAHGTELWKSDGTAAGTVMVKDIFPGAGGSNPSQLINVNGILYFSADDSQHGTELWKSNGTAAGTIMVSDINQGEDGSNPEWLNAMNGRVYFTAFHPDTGRELWRSNGIASGTVLIKNFISGAGSPIRITELVTMGNAIYFIVDDALWRSSGTSYGTSLVKDLSPEDPYVYEARYYLTPVNEKLYFAANGNLWVSDGRSTGTNPASAMRVGSNPYFKLYKESIYYFDYFFEDEIYTLYYRLRKMNKDGTDNTEVWRTPEYPNWNEDGTPDFLPELAVMNNMLFFYGIPGEGQGHKLMKSDGTPEGTVIIKDTYVPTISSSPDGFVSLNGVVYFKSPGQNENPRYVYRTDGTRSGTFLLKSFELHRELVVANNNVYFSGYSDQDYWQLWKTNGTTSGTILIKQDNTSSWSIPVGIDNAVLFYNNAGELWKSDGTPSGTILIKKVNAIEQIASALNRAYLLVRNISGELEIWKTNGTAEGTVKIETLQPATGYDPSYYFFPNSTVNGITFFFGTDGSKGHEVWRTNGTASGTYRIKEIRMNSVSAQIVQRVRSVVVFKNSFYFSAPDENREFALYRSNGTSYTTAKIVKLPAIVQYIPLGENLLLFPYRSGTNLSDPPVMWITDGTTAGTDPVKAIEGVTFFAEVDYEVIDGVAYFTLYEGENLWRTDGTECGTFSLPTGLTQVSPIASIGNVLVLGGYGNYLYGRELYRYDLANALPSPCGIEMASAMNSPVEDLATSPETEIVTSAPNPFNDDFSLRINATDQTKASLNVYSIDGRLVESIVLTCNVKHQLGQKWPPGFYLLSIRIGNTSTSRKVIKR